MPVPSYGAAPLAKTFVLARGLSLVAMFALVGITAHFVGQIVETNIDPPQEVIATLAIACLAAFYCLITLPLFYSEAHTMTLLIITGVDAALLLCFLTISVVLGRPVSFLDCANIQSTSIDPSTTSAYAFVQSLQDNLGKDGSRLGLSNWAGSTEARCYQTKAVWGLSISLTILFAVSVVLLPVLWMKARRAGLMGGKGAA